jgi:hypothetical protein
MEELPKTSMTFRLNRSGIKTIRNSQGVFLEYQDKRIIRPAVSNCEWKVKQEFGVEI